MTCDVARQSLCSHCNWAGTSKSRASQLRCSSHKDGRLLLHLFRMVLAAGFDQHGSRTADCAQLVAAHPFVCWLDMPDPLLLSSAMSAQLPSFAMRVTSTLTPDDQVLGWSLTCPYVLICCPAHPAVPCCAAVEATVHARVSSRGPAAGARCQHAATTTNSSSSNNTPKLL